MPEQSGPNPRKRGLGGLIYNLVNRVIYGRPKPTYQRRRRVELAGLPPMVSDDQADTMFAYYGEKMRLAKTRLEVYDEVDAMDADDLPGSTLDTYAEDATPLDPAAGRVVWIENTRPDLQAILHDCMDRIRLEEYALLIVRSMAKYGDFPVEPYWEPGEGIQTLRFHHPKKFRRYEEAATGMLVGFYLGLAPASGAPGPNMKPWELVHFRALGSLSAMYGSSSLIGARKPYRRLRLVEDFGVIYELMKHPDRDVFELDVTGMTDQEQADYVNRFIQAIRKKRFYDSTTGELRDDWNPFTTSEDLIVPQVQGHETKIQRLKGSTNVREVTREDYYLGRYHCAVRIPPAHFGYIIQGGQPYDPQKALGQQSTRYAKIPMKLQRYFLFGVHRLLQLELAFRGIDPSLEDNQFTLAMGPVSYLDELHRLQLIEIRTDIIDRLVNLGKTCGFDMTKWLRYLLKEYAKLSDKMIDELMIPVEQLGERPGPPGAPTDAGKAPPAPPPAPPPSPPGAEAVGMEPVAGAPEEQGLPAGAESLPAEARRALLEAAKKLTKIAAERQVRVTPEDAARFLLREGKLFSVEDAGAVPKKGESDFGDADEQQQPMRCEDFEDLVSSRAREE